MFSAHSRLVMQRGEGSGNGSHPPYLRNNLIPYTMTIQVTKGSYGFGHEWTLNAYGRNFYLGQDVKFCSRVLGMEPSTIIQQAGIQHPCDMGKESNRKAIARFICGQLGVTRGTAKTLQPWDLCAQ